MKELLTEYQKKSDIIYNMINIEKDPETLIILKAKSNCYSEIINDLENKIKSQDEIILNDKMVMFLKSLETDLKPHHYSIKKGFFPYLGLINYKELTPLAIVIKIHEHGFLAGIETGKYQKTLELKRVLDIDISED